MSNNPYKSYRDITTEIETYGNSPGTLGNMPSLYKTGLAISSINPTNYDYKSVKIITDDLIEKINILKTEYSTSCGEGVGASKCQKKVRACESLLVDLSLVSGKVSKTLTRGGSRRKTMKGRRKQNKSRRNRKSRR
jgi:hypothetical protein